MATNKVVFGGQTVVDLTQDTATEETVLEGYTFHKANGQQAVGTATSGGGGSTATFTSNVNIEQLDDMDTGEMYVGYTSAELVVGNRYKFWAMRYFTVTMVDGQGRTLPVLNTVSSGKMFAWEFIMPSTGATSTATVTS